MRRRLVIAADPRRQIGVELRAEDTRRVPVDALAGGERDLGELLGRAGDDGREVHHLGQADHAVARQDPGDVRQRERRPRRLERARRDGRRREHGTSIGRPSQTVDEPVHALGAEGVGELVRIADDGGRPARNQHARQLPTLSLHDSTCMCASMKPALRKCPRPSMRSPPSYAPTPAKRPSAIATSPSSHSRVNAQNTCAPSITVSGASSPRATASRRAVGGASCMPGP